MSPEAWAFGGVLCTNVCGLVALAIQQRRQHLENRSANVSIERQLRPNGDRPLHEGGSLADSLHRIEMRLDTHITQHGRGST